MTSTQTQLKLNQYLNQINYNIDLLDQSIKIIGEAIMFAKVGIVSPNLINYQEFNEYTRKNNVTANSELFQQLSLQAYYNHSEIIFAVKIPNFQASECSFYALHRIPMKNNLTISLNYPYLVMNENYYQFLTHTCRVINSRYYCKITQLTRLNQSNCIIQLIKNQPAHCEVTNSQNTNSVDIVHNEYLIISSINKLKIITSCNNSTKTIYGNILIKFNNCSVTINGITYFNKIVKSRSKTQAELITFNDLNITKFTQNINFNSIQELTNLHQEQIEVLTIETRKHGYGIFGIASFATAFGAIILYLKCFRNRQTSPKPPVVFSEVSYSIQPTSPPQQLVELPWLKSKEGGVIIST